MALTPIGATAVTPPTSFFWDDDAQATVEITELGEEAYLLRVTKSYRLVKQDETGQENWDRNLRKMNEYLAETFPSFRISVDYVNEVAPEATETRAEATQLRDRAGTVLAETRQLQEKLRVLERATDVGLDSLTDRLEDVVAETEHQLALDEAELDRITDHLERKKRELGEWQRNGVMVSYVFTFSTDPEVVTAGALDEAIKNHLDDAFNYHRRKVKQVLQGSTFKLVVDEMETPRVLHRLEYTQLLNPTSLDILVEEAPALESTLAQLHDEAVSQYAAFALDDLEVEEGTFERSKATPARAVNSLLQGLEAEGVASVEDVPDDGPLLGTVKGTDIPVGFDLKEQPHYYIVGATGSGKTHVKRVLVENCASQGYHVLSLSPADREAIGAAFPNPEVDHGRGLTANQYWMDNELLLDLPADLTTLLTGVNFVTLDEASNADKKEFVTALFETVTDGRSFEKPLFVFLDEANLFSDGAPAEAIQQAVRRTRKHGVHVVLITQSPMDFNYTYKHIRENTTGNFFVQGEYYDYAANYLSDETEIRTLDTGHALFFGRGQPRLDIDVRQTVSLLGEPSKADIADLDDRLHESPPGVDRGQPPAQQSTHQTRDVALSGDEERVVSAIRTYIQENDERPSFNQVKKGAGFGVSKTTSLLADLEETGVVEMNWGTRSGNRAKLYSLV